MTNRFCVYLHRRADNGVVFYVGEGTVRRVRAACRYTRGKKWHETVLSAGGFSFEIVRSGLTKEDAQQLEKELIQQYPFLINTKANTQPREITESDRELLREFLVYDNTSPSGLRWKSGKLSGKEAGSAYCVNGKYYWGVTLKGRHYRAHRVIMVLEGHTFKKSDVINHIDGDGLNNNLTNLEVCTQSENMRNVNTRNSTLPGVKYNKTNNAWVAHWQENFKQKHKYFSVKKYGYEVAKNLAIEYRLKVTSQ